MCVVSLFDENHLAHVGDIEQPDILHLVYAPFKGRDSATAETGLQSQTYELATRYSMILA